MSGTAAKSTRREIRRAFGPEAVGVISAQDQALTEHARAIREQEQRIESHHLEIEANNIHYAELRRDLDDFTDRSVWQRLRWLFRGV